MGGGLKVRSEGAAGRCEICHQSDCLDPVTGQCARCNDMVIPDQLRPARLEEEKPSGLIIPFGRTWVTQAVAALMVVLFSMTFIGPYGAIFFAGLCCFFTGLRRVLADTEITGRPQVDFALNLVLMSAGFGGCCFGGLYFLRIIGVLK